jgi:hypothetical protein
MLERNSSAGPDLSPLTPNNAVAAPISMGADVEEVSASLKVDETEKDGVEICTIKQLSNREAPNACKDLLTNTNSLKNSRDIEIFSFMLNFFRILICKCSFIIKYSIDLLSFEAIS